MRRRRSRLAVAVGVVALIAAAPPARASDGPPRPNAAAWLLVDTADGTRLAAHSPNRQRSIAGADDPGAAAEELRAAVWSISGG